MLIRPLWISCALALSLTAVAAPPPLVVDGDADGVSDERDDCPYTPLAVKVLPNGCPVSRTDGDDDTVADEADHCPYTPAGAQVDADGCALDNDFDGIADGVDRCPETAFGAHVDVLGCSQGQVATTAMGKHVVASRLPPPLTPASIAPTMADISTAPHSREAPASIASPAPLPMAVAVTALPYATPLAEPTPVSSAAPTPPPAVAPTSATTAEALAQSVYFGVSSAELPADALELLRSIASVLTHSQTPVHITGHASRSEGEKAGELAQQRADLVRSYLAARGVARARLKALTQVAPDGTRRQARRVDIEAMR